MGRTGDARTAVDAALEVLKPRPDGALVEALQASARIHFAAGDRTAAQADAREAQALYDARVPDGHPLRARAAALVPETRTLPATTP